MEIPNLEVLREISSNITKEYDLENRLNRYKNLAPELIEFAQNSGLSSSDEAIRALFVADFIVTASEVPKGIVDEERYNSVFKAFIQGKSRCKSLDSIMQIFYFAYKTATLIRRQDLFMAGRGIGRDIALIRIKDCYITPYLQISSEILGEGSCGWELGILSAALTRNFPELEITQYLKIPEYSKHRWTTEPIWKVLKRYADVQKVETNTNIVIPNMNETQNILMFNQDDTSQIAMWGIPLENISKIGGSIQSIAQTFDRELKLENTQLIFLKGTIADSSKNLLILKDPFTSSKPLTIFISPVDEINVSRILTVLSFRGSEDNGWKAVFTKPKITEEIPKPVLKPELKPSDKPLVDEKNKETPSPQKISIFRKITKLFGKKEKKITSESIPSVTKIERQKDKKEKKKELPPFIKQGEFLSQAITIDAVSDIDLFETFDTIREEEKGYSVLGIFDTDLEDGKTILCTSSHIDIQKQFLKFFNSLNKIITPIIEVFKAEKPILFKEGFLINPDNNQKLILSINSNQERVVGTIASSEFNKIADWHARAVDKEPLQRRSIHMRTAQFLSARRHSTFEDASKRIFGENFDLGNANEITIDQRIPSLEHIFKEIK